MPEKLDFSKENLKKFGRTMGFCFFAIGLILFLRHKAAFKIFWTAGLIFLALSQFYVLWLKLIYKLWVGLAFCLGWFNTRLILIAVYYLLVTPIGLAVRLFGKDFLNVKLDRSAKTYWQQRETVNIPKERYERIF